MAPKFVKLGKVVLLFLFCLSLSLSVLISDEKFTASQLSEEAISPTRQYLDFVFFHAAFPEIFTGDEASHMRDVAWLLRIAAVIAMLSGIVLLAITKSSELNVIAIRSLAVFAVVGVLALITPFNVIFHVFHLIFFPQGNWMFPVDSTLISFYPQDFFVWYAFSWFAYSLFTAVVLVFFGRLLSR